MTDQPVPVRYLVPGSAAWRDVEVATATGSAGSDALSSHLLASLQMQNLLVLTGLGTSLEVGGPTMEALWNSCIGTPTSTAADTVMRALNYDPARKNIEELLSCCDAQILAAGDKDGINDFRKSCVSTILSRCREVAGEKHDLGTHREFVRKLARRRARDPRLRLFTTNYDLCFERAAGQLGLTTIDGFSFTAPRRFDPRFFEYDIVRRVPVAADNAGYVPGVFQYFKIHGSVDWEIGETGIVTINEAAPPERACLIYPTRQKFQLSFQQPHLELMAQFLAALRQANTCLLVLGFGFNDDHLTEPILSALETNPHLRLIVVSPRSDEHYDTGKTQVWKRLRRSFERGDDVAFVRASFSRFVPLIPDLRVLTPGERLERDIRQLIDKP
jgi:hypothetical protein